MTTTTARKPKSNEAPEGTRFTKAGFPVTLCTRCGGSGRYPSACYNGVCLGCSGSGVKDYNSSSRRLRVQYEAAAAAAQQTDPRELQVGDTVLVLAGFMSANHKWEKIEQIEISEPGSYGWVQVGDTVTRFVQQIEITTKSAVSVFRISEDGQAQPVRRWDGRLDSTPWTSRINYNAR